MKILTDTSIPVLHLDGRVINIWHFGPWPEYHYYPEDFAGAVKRKEKHAIVATWGEVFASYFFPAETVFLTFKKYKHKRSAVRAARKWVSK